MTRANDEEIDVLGELEAQNRVIERRLNDWRPDPGHVAL
jgi:hypothetical protein